MYTEGLTLSQAREWEQQLQTDVGDASLSASRREQAQTDLQDVRAHITALSPR